MNIRLMTPDFQDRTLYYQLCLMSLIPLPESLGPFLDPYLPHPLDRLFVTLTYAQSVDSRISSKPGVQTKISHLETKTMTHYLRSKHDAIMVGIGTVLADDPKLNCRYESGKSPRPVILDPHGKWQYHKSQLRQICDDHQGLAPYILIDETTQPSSEDVAILANQGGKHVRLEFNKEDTSANWTTVTQVLFNMGIKSVMIEGGAKVINDLLAFKQNSKSIIDSLIITIGPVFLGNQGVEVSPSKHIDLTDVKWWTGIQDSILCANIEH